MMIYVTGSSLLGRKKKIEVIIIRKVIRKRRPKTAPENGDV